MPHSPRSRLTGIALALAVVLAAVVVFIVTGRATSRRAEAVIARGDLAALNRMLDNGLSPNSLFRAIRGLESGEPYVISRRLLHVASSAGQTEIAAVLLNAGADIDARDQDGMTPLMLAARTDHRDTCLLLSDRGADASLRCHLQRTALDWAVGGYAGPPTVLVLLLPRLSAGLDDPDRKHAMLSVGNHRTDSAKPIIAQLLSDSSAAVQSIAEGSIDCAASFTGGWSGMHWACTTFGTLEDLQRCAAAATDIDRATDSGVTPLMLASQSNGADKVALILDRGAMVDRADARGWTALHYACNAAGSQVVSLLLHRGAYLDVEGQMGVTPRMLAKARSDANGRAIVDLLPGR